MKTLIVTSSIGTLLLGTSLVLAQTPTDEHAGHHPEGTPLPAASTPLPGKDADSAAMAKMQRNMMQMKDLMEKIHSSKDGAERQQLLQQHSKAMQDQMAMMRGMGGGPGGMADGGMKMGEGMKGGGTPPPNAKSGSPMGDGMMSQMMKNHQAMQGRMDMMEMMMGQMLEHQDAQQGASGAKPAK